MEECLKHILEKRQGNISVKYRNRTQYHFFVKRLIHYIIVLNIPIVIIFFVTFCASEIQRERKLKDESNNTLASVNANLDMVIYNVLFQNDLLTVNSHMLLAIRKIMSSDKKISYSDGIYIRNIKTLMSSITRTYPYIMSTQMYLDEYESYLSSDKGVVSFGENNEPEWMSYYLSMPEQRENYVMYRKVSDREGDKELITVFNRMLLLDGVVIMDIELGAYKKLLDSLIANEDESVLVFNSEGVFVFGWNDESGIDWSQVQVDDFVKYEWYVQEHQKFWVNKSVNNSYGLTLISLTPHRIKINGMLPTLKVFAWFWLASLLVVSFIAYITNKRNFDQIDYLITAFDDAENRRFPTEPQKTVKDEYGIIMNNIIHVFLQTVQLNERLLKRKQENEIADIKALQLQINPHFLLNTLQCVEFQLKKIGDAGKDAYAIVEHLSDVLKYTLDDPLTMTTLFDEVEHLKKYVKIQQYRFLEDFIVYYEIEECLFDFKVFRLMLQPLIENSFQHGIRKTERKGYIKVKVIRHKEELCFSVIDNGIGLSEEKLHSLQRNVEVVTTRNIGLANVNNRLKLHYGEKAKLKILSRKGWGCVVKFKIPIEKVSY